MKRKYVFFLLLIVPMFLFGCDNKNTTSKSMVCKKTMPYNDTQIKWNNEINIKYANETIDNIEIKEIITVDPSVGEERIASFKNLIELECTGDLGRKFDSCNLTSEGNVFTITMTTKKIDVLDSAVSSSVDGNALDNGSVETLKDYLQKLEYTCEGA